MMRTHMFVATMVLGVSGCNVPEPPRPGGSLHLDAATHLDGAAPGSCGRGFVVVEEPDDYASTNVALVANDGRILSESIASSATTSVGLTAPLSGDVVAPTMRVTGPEIVLIDRGAAASRIVWVDIATAKKRELQVGKGFYANPHDYAEISRTKAYVTRYGSNRVPGKQPYDRGSDVLVVDPSVPSITASIDMTAALGSDASRALPRPGGLVVVGARAFVLLGALPGDFSVGVSSRLVTLDTAADVVTDVFTLDGFTNCMGMALSPTGKELSVLCSGKIDPNAPSDLGGSGILRIDVTSTPRLTKTWAGADLGEGPVGFSADYAAPSVLVFQTFGYFASNGTAVVNDTFASLDLETGNVSKLLESAGEPFTLWGVACDSFCRVCLAADARRQGGVVHRFTVDAQGRLEDGRAIKVETRIGLPPRYVGRF